MIPTGAIMLQQLHSGVSEHTTVVYCTSGKAPMCDALWPPVSTPVEVIVVPHKTWGAEGSVTDVDHDGRTIRVKFVMCQVADDATIACTGVAPPPPDSVRVVNVVEAGPSDVGRVIAVHRHDRNGGHYLTADSGFAPYGILGLGCLLAVIGVVELVQRLRRPNPPTGRVDPEYEGFRPL
jgi:hypothetical protein